LGEQRFIAVALVGAADFSADLRELVREHPSRKHTPKASFLSKQAWERTRELQADGNGDKQELL